MSNLQSRDSFGRDSMTEHLLEDCQLTWESMPLIMSFFRSCSSLSKAGLRKVDLGVGTGFLFEAGEAGAAPPPWELSPFIVSNHVSSHEDVLGVVLHDLMTVF